MEVMYRSNLKDLKKKADDTYRREKIYYTIKEIYDQTIRQASISETCLTHYSINHAGGIKSEFIYANIDDILYGVREKFPDSVVTLKKIDYQHYIVVDWS
jgi:hypothetical protein